MAWRYLADGTSQVIFFTDFDGTITRKDTNDFMTDNLGMGATRRKALNKDCLDGKVDFRDTFQEMIDSIGTPFPECLQQLCDNIDLDPYFKGFYEWARANGVPVVVLSSGMTEVISTLLVHLLGPQGKDIPIVCNEKVDDPNKAGGWSIQFHDESGFGHDKSMTIRPYREHFDQRPEEPRPTMLYAGDGVSDFSAARETDLLFAKAGHGE
jgi:2,3-diketo-5-methylthio-1-phosphopentane phosphatase